MKKTLNLLTTVILTIIVCLCALIGGIEYATKENAKKEMLAKQHEQKEIFKSQIIVE